MEANQTTSGSGEAGIRSSEFSRGDLFNPGTKWETGQTNLCQEQAFQDWNRETPAPGCRPIDTPQSSRNHEHPVKGRESQLGPLDSKRADANDHSTVTRPGPRPFAL
jgi:hypothetical protein